MKKALALVLALVLSLSVCTVALAKNEHHFNFGWEKPSFDFDYDFGFDFGDGHHKDDSLHQPATPTDTPQKPDREDDREEQKPQNQGQQSGQRPDDVPQRPEGSDCTPGDENCSDREEPTVTKTDVTNIFDVIKYLKDKLQNAKDFFLPKNNDTFYIVGMVITEDGKIEFIYVEKGQEDKGEQRLPCQKDDVTATDVTATDIPDGMDLITMGDTDVDGKVSAKDALAILKHLVKFIM